MSKTFLLAVLSLSLAIPADIGKNNKVSLEDKTKAVFIYHFTKYIQWPDSDSLTAFRIAVLGQPNILLPLNEIKNKKSIQGTPIKITTYRVLPDTLNCHMLFIPKSHFKQIPSILKKVKNKPILTISDSPGFAEAGVAINFFMHQGKIKFEINGSTIDSTRLIISSQLLKLARFVKAKE